MRYLVKSLVLLLIALPLAAACSRATDGQRVGQAPAAPVPPGGDAAVGVIPGHPPVTTSGVVASLDPNSGLLTFKDGRILKITDRTKIFPPADSPTIRPGQPVLVQDALPVGVRTASTAAKGNKDQRMGTVAAVDVPNGLVRLTDGNTIHVSPATKIHMGTDDAAIVLGDLRPGDELVIVISEANPAAAVTGAAGTAGAGTMTTTSASNPSEPARQAFSPAPIEGSELMVFRNQAP